MRSGLSSIHLSLRQLLIFVAVADAGSTIAAGRHLSLSQSAASSALNELETLLRTRLFDRVGKRLVLNENGRALLPQARSLLDGASGIERDFGVGVGQSPAGRPAPAHLRIAASTTIGNYLLPALVAGFRNQQPQARVGVQIANTRDVSAWVARLEVDLALIEGPCHEPDVHAEPWMEDELVIVAAPGHPLLQGARAQCLSAESLRRIPWLLREPGSGTREAVEHALLPHLDQVIEDMQFGSTEAIKRAAAAGLGLTCLSLCAVQDQLNLGELQIVDTALPRLTRRFYMIRHRGKQFSASLERFVAYVREWTVDQLRR